MTNRHDPFAASERTAALLGVAFSVATYAFAMVVMLAFFDFLAGTMLLPFGGVDHGPVGVVHGALLVDLGLVLAFGITHSVMARDAFKQVWTRIVPPALERTTFVLVSALSLGALVMLWRPVPGTVWSADGAGLSLLLDLLFATGVLLTIASTFQISHAELFGLKQPWAAMRGTAEEHGEFRIPLLYRFVRHPMQLGLLMTLWSAPVLTVGRVMLATSLTAYVLVGLVFEERALMRTFGERYEAYRRHVPRLIPRLTPNGVIIAASVVLIALTVSTGGITGSGVSVTRVQHAGLKRTYRVVDADTRPALPLSAGLPVFIAPVASTRGLSGGPGLAPRSRPVLFVLHGRGQDGALARRLAGAELESLLFERDWIVVYPDGYRRSWNDCRASLAYPAHVDAVPDVSFLASIAHALVASHGADTTRVFVLGFSNGGHMAHRFAAEAPGMVRAVAVAGANLPADQQQQCMSRAPTFFISGERDVVSPAAGGLMTLPQGGHGGMVLSSLASAERAAVHDPVGIVPPLVLAGVGHELPVTRGRAPALGRWGDYAQPSVLALVLRFFLDSGAE